MAVRIVADVLIPGRGDPIEYATVVLAGNIITYAGPTSNAPPPRDDEVVTAVPAVLPGLWDAHSHFVGMNRPNIDSLATTDPVTAAARATADLRAVVEGGVTSVRELGGMGIGLGRAIAEGRILGPTVHAAGRILSPTGGHGDLHGIPMEAMQALLGNQSFSTLCDGVPEVLKAVRANLRDNAKLIRVCASGGIMSVVDHPMHQQFSDEELSAIVEEAARADRIVAAHCHGKAGIMAAIRAGCHTIEHGSFLDEEAAESMARNDMMFVPSRYVIDALISEPQNLPHHVYEKSQMVASAHEKAMKIAISKGVSHGDRLRFVRVRPVLRHREPRGAEPDQRRPDRSRGDRGGDRERSRNPRPSRTDERPAQERFRRRRHRLRRQPAQ